MYDHVEMILDWRWWQVDETVAAGRQPTMLVWKRSSCSPRSKHSSIGSENFKFKTQSTLTVHPPENELVNWHFFQNYKLFTQPAGKATLAETQARKVRNWEICVSLLRVSPKTVGHAFFLQQIFSSTLCTKFQQSPSKCRRSLQFNFTSPPLQFGQLCSTITVQFHVFLSEKKLICIMIHLY